MYNNNTNEDLIKTISNNFNKTIIEIENNEYYVLIYDGINAYIFDYLNNHTNY